MELDPQKSSHEVSIALIQKDIEYIKQSIVSINTQVQVMDKHYARHDDLLTLSKIQDEFKHNLDLKVDKNDFEPIKRTLQRINWLIIAAILTGLLALLFKQ